MTLTPSEKALIRTFIRHAQTSVADLSALLADDENPDTEVGHPASMLPPEATLQRTVLTALEDSEVGLRVSEICRRDGRSLDPPNVDTALRKLEERGLVERVPGATPTRWRWAAQWRPRAA